MTTIAYNYEDSQIAVDGRITIENMIVSDNAIKFKRDGRSIWFFCGSVSDNDTLMGMKHDYAPKVIPDCSALLFDNGKVFLVSFNKGHCSHTLINYNMAIGSGESFAISAMDFGKSAKESVHYASKRDCKTGGKIRVFNLKK